MEDIQVMGDIGSFAAFVILAVIIFGGIAAYKYSKKDK